MLKPEIDYTPSKDEMLLREMLWLRHGCEIASLYSDDGEMQCGACMIDFKRAPVELIRERFHKVGMERLAAAGNIFAQAELKLRQEQSTTIERG